MAGGLDLGLEGRFGVFLEASEFLVECRRERRGNWECSSRQTRRGVANVGNRVIPWDGAM
jgi:hypothetical protein